MKNYYPGIGHVENMIELMETSDKSFTCGKEGVEAIYTPQDRKVEFVSFADKTMCYVKSAMGYPAWYKVPEAHYEGPTSAILIVVAA